MLQTPECIIFVCTIIMSEKASDVFCKISCSIGHFLCEVNNLTYVHFYSAINMLSIEKTQTMLSCDQVVGLRYS